MAAKKDDVTTYTKAELIKALRASVAREAKLQKRIAALEGDIARRRQTTYGDPGLLPQEPAPPAFPWDVK